LDYEKKINAAINKYFFHNHKGQLCFEDKYIEQNNAACPKCNLFWGRKAVKKAKKYITP
jgi:hypothetical protein